MNRTEDVATFDLPFAGVRSGQAHSVGSSPQPVQASANAASTCSRVWPVRVWMRPTSSCSLSSTNRRSSSVSFAHFCLSFPLTIFQLPLISNVFISSILLLGLARALAVLPVARRPFFPAGAVPRTRERGGGQIGERLGKIGDRACRCRLALCRERTRATANCTWGGPWAVMAGSPGPAGDGSREELFVDRAQPGEEIVAVSLRACIFNQKQDL